MKQIRLVKGNNVTFRIEVTQKEGNSSVPVNFGGVSDLEVYMHNCGKRKMNVTVADNVIVMPVGGQEQMTGDVGVEAVWGGNAHRFFYRNVCSFVNSTDEANYLYPDDISVETVELSAEVSAAASGSSSGKSPYIGENGNWFEFNDQADAWADTGIKAVGQKGADAPLPQIQYSSDGASWHIAKADSDIYWRISVDGGITWGDAVFFKDEVLTSSETGAVKTIQPNVFYIWGETASLDITLAAPANSNILNEYMFQFASGQTATTLTLPASVVFPSAVTIKSGKTYQVSIVNNLGLIGEF